MTATLQRTPTSVANLARIEAFVASVSNLVQNLACRWQDEKDYEDINEYRERIARELPAGFAITAMTKRPFGFKFTIGTDAEYAIFCSTTQYGWKRTQ